MVSIIEVTIISIDKSDEETWFIEGEILFDGDLTSPFSTSYYVEDDEFDQFELETDPGKHDTRLLKKMIISACDEFDDY